jgi:hypothetical protein
MTTKSAPIKKIALYAALAVCFAALLVLMLVNTSRLSSTKTELESTRVEFSATQTNIASAAASLSLAKIELSQAKSDLADVQKDLSCKQAELGSAKAKLEQAKASLTSAQTTYTATMATYNTQKAASATLQGKYDLLKAEYLAKTSVYSYALRDPTYQEVKDFLKADKTNTNLYITAKYVCENFSADTVANAQKQKIRNGCVQITLAGIRHALIAFNTTDKGIIYVEPQTDEEVNLQIGKHYWSECVGKPGSYSIPKDYDDTIVSFFIIW